MLTAEERAARERKQKIFVVVGGLVLLALLAFQLPRILGGGSSAASSTTTTTTAAVDTDPGTTESPTAAPATRSSAPVALVDSDRPLRPAQGQLGSFSEFAGKDPFVQQVSFSNAATAATAPAAKSTGGEGKSDSKPASKGFTVGGTPAAAVTVISVNGARQALVPGAAFPASDPVFVLVSEQQQAKSVTIGIAGGGYASGSKTTKLRVGTPLVLVNTTTGARYKLVLVAVGNGQAQATPEKSSPSSSSAKPKQPATTP
jgi:hypothetical protein